MLLSSTSHESKCKKDRQGKIWTLGYGNGSLFRDRKRVFKATRRERLKHRVSRQKARHCLRSWDRISRKSSAYIAERFKWISAMNILSVRSKKLRRVSISVLSSQMLAPEIPDLLSKRIEMIY